VVIVVNPASSRATTRLADVCSVQNGYPFESAFYSKRDGIPLIRVRSLKTQTCDIYYNGPFDKSYLVNNGDVLIGMDGDFQPCYWQGGKALLNQRVSRLINFIDTVNPYYIYQALKKPLQDIENTTHFTTVKHLSSFTIQEIRIDLPPLPEQRAIAHILQTTQNAMQTRRKELDLERERKAALMQHLFTHGTHNEPTKQSEVGEIPESWKVVELNQVADIVYGVQAAVAHLLDGSRGIPILTNINISNDGQLDLTTLRYYNLPSDKQAKLLLRKGDLLFNWRSGSQYHVGKTALFDLDGEYTFSSFILRLRPLGNINNIFLLYYLYYIKSAGYFIKQTQQSSVNSVFNASIAAKIPVTIAAPQEQKDIATILQACDAKITALEKEIALHEEFFRVLLEELMTGRLSTRALIE
jgi:type I restriction enzyme S subunit